MGASALRLLTLALLAAAPGASAAHALTGAVQAGAGFGAVVAGLLAAATVCYARGVTRLWRKAGRARGIRVGDAACFAVGIGALAAALLSPLDALAARSFAAHMVEHELLMVVAAPLLVLARPLEAWAWGVPVALQTGLRAVARARAVRAVFAFCTAPLVATLLHALALWLWHVPALFVQALSSEAAHVVQHACFLATALAFWWAAFGGPARTPGVLALGCLFATMLHTSMLGAVLTLAPAPLYLPAGNTPVPGLSALEDQQLGGLVMWVPGGLAYLIAALAIVASWLRAPAGARAGLRPAVLPQRVGAKVQRIR